jgi:DNA-binding transcriptional MocR family regulator
MVTSTNTCGGPGSSTGSDTDGWAEHSTRCPLATANSRRRAGLHLAVTGPDTPDDDQLLAATAERDMLIGSLRHCYQVNDPLPGFLVGFGALATDRVEAAVQTLRSALLDQST